MSVCCQCLQAKKKGASATVAGVILGIYEVVIIVLSPVYGNYVSPFMFLLLNTSEIVITMNILLPYHNKLRPSRNGN